MFCGLMNVPPPPRKFDKIVNSMALTVEAVAKETMDEAIAHAIVKNENSIDGLWQKRGHTSLNGCISATSVDNGQIVDIAIFSKHCVCQNKLKNQHDITCKANYQGTSGGMEVAGVNEIYNRPLTKNVRYKYYLGDGDSKGFDSVSSAKIYGPDHPIEKLECIGHIQKRMGERLRTMKTKKGGGQLSDGKTIGGRGQLTNDSILKIQKTKCGKCRKYV